MVKDDRFFDGHLIPLEEYPDDFYERMIERQNEKFFRKYCQKEEVIEQESSLLISDGFSNLFHKKQL